MALNKHDNNFNFPLSNIIPFMGFIVYIEFYLNLIDLKCWIGQNVF